MVGFFLLSQSTKSLHMDTHEEQDTHLRDPHGSRVEIHIDHPMAEEALDPDLGDHGLVDMVDFCLRKMRTEGLELHIASINQNLMDLTTLVKNIVINLVFMPPGTGGASQPSLVEPQVHVTESGGGDGAQHPSAETSGVNPPIILPVTTPEISNSLKNLKPSMFQGEEKDQNKDSMHTFIQKWMNFHVLR